jgi:GrpB-like predicted nucleotidyltransferase (UPF0157 family)
VPITVVPYDPTWPEQFERVRADLATALAAVPIVAIEHVGSTSVPGLAAKLVLDIDVVVDRVHLDQAIEALVAAGYTHEGDKGVPGRHFLRAPDHDPARHVYTIVDGSLALRNHLAVRDTLRNDAELRDAYAAVKLGLASRVEDMADYIDGKSEVLQRILTAAGITTDDRGAILDLNRKQV